MRRLSRSSARIFLLILLVGLVGVCTSEAPSTEGSSGRWNIEESPSVAIGASPATPGAALHQVHDAVRLPDGSIVVADGGLGAARVARFGPDGGFEDLLGGSGDGPGEFQWITSLGYLRGDSLFVFDAQAQRLTILGTGGAVRRTSNVQAEAGTGRVRLRTLVPMTGGFWTWRELGRPRWGGTPEILYDTIAVGVADPSLRSFEALAALPGPMSTTVEVDGRRILGLPAFAPYPSVVTWGRCVFVTPGSTASISVYSIEGELVRVLEGPGGARPVTQEHLDALLAHRLQRAPPGDESAIRRRHAEAASMSELPYYHQMVVDDWGHVWLQEYAPPRGLGSRWYVMSQTGELLGEVDWPEKIDVHAIGPAGVLGRTRGALDEEHIELRAWTGLPSRQAEPLEECAP